MSIDNITLDFYKRTFESHVNEKMLEYDYIFPADRVKDYISSITSVEMSEFLNTLISVGDDEVITTADLLQFSSLNDATEIICSSLIEEKNPGMEAVEIGRLLLKNEEPKKKLAYRKYGENHAKAAEAFGLVYSITKVYFLSCIGMEYPYLNQRLKERLLARMVLRTKEIEQLYRLYVSGNSISAREYMRDLSDSTYRRRRSNLRRLLRVLQVNDEYDFSPFINSIEIE